MKTRCRSVAYGACLLSVAAVSLAQGSGNEFRGIWRGTLSPNIVLGVSEEDMARLSQPVVFELRVFNRGRAEVYFSSDNDEWELDFSETADICGGGPASDDGRSVQLQEVGANGAILIRFPGATDNSQHAFSFNLTKIDDETLLVDWSKISTRCILRNDGLDQLAFAGSDELRLVD